jgi:hypothetical protein
MDDQGTVICTCLGFLGIKTIKDLIFCLAAQGAKASTTNALEQGSRTKEEVSVWLTSMYYLVLPAFQTETKFSFFYKTTYLNEEVNCTEPSLSVRVP